jgi:hypothetical protein
MHAANPDARTIAEGACAGFDELGGACVAVVSRPAGAGLVALALVCVEEPPHAPSTPVARSAGSTALHARTRRLRLHCVIDLLPSILGLAALPVVLRRGWPFQNIFKGAPINAGSRHAKTAVG